MPRANNPAIGRIACSLCGKMSSVKLNSKGYYYYGCQNCGVDQRKGAVLQTRIYREAEWLTEEVPPPPPNLLIDDVSETEKTKDEKAERDSVTEKEEKQGQNEKKESVNSKSGFAALLVASIAAVVLFPFKGSV